MRPVLVAAVLAAAFLPACGDDPNGQPDAGADAGPGDLEAFFSLQKGRCFEYTTFDSKQFAADLGVAVEAYDDAQFSQVTPRTWVVRYRLGQLRMIDYVAAEGGALKLFKREYRGGKTYIYRPALTLLEAPVRGNAKIESTSTVSVYDASGTLLPTESGSTTLRVDTLEPAQLSLPMPGQTVSGTKVLFDQTPPVRAEYRTFVPGTGDRTAADGWVVIEHNFDMDPSKAAIIYKLQNVRELGTDQQAAQYPCGITP